MTERIKLSEIALISAGQTFRGKAESETGNSSVKLLQIKDVKEGFYAGGALPWADVDLKKKPILLNGGELLLPLRGNRSEVMLYEPHDTCPVTTPNQVAIVRLVSTAVRPEYLLWYLNSNEGRAQIDLTRSGTTVGHISTKSLADIDLIVPTPAIQYEISRIYANWLEQRKILVQMIDVVAEMSEILCVDMIKSSGVVN